ncbi:MAG: hypothetical protein COA44_06215 [Arcobacter sp.]|nr:MAG: hypothetical protein COA44_06215 [Arcobacter sp.]
MSFDSERKRLGKEPVTLVELDLDFCSLSFSGAPCTATGVPCYNTRNTCKDAANFTKGTKTYTMITKGASAPVGQVMFPCVKKVSYSPTKLTFGNGLGYRSKVTITFQDFAHHDRGIDPYQSQRTYDTNQGTFFGKLLARNTYYNGRTIRIRTGYQATPFSLDNFDTREYIIEKIDISANGVVKIVGKDILKKIDNKRSQCPKVSEGLLSADMTKTATSITLLPGGIGLDYPDSGVIRIGDEIMSYSSKNVDTLQGLVRAGFGTEADDAQDEDTVQLCKIYDNLNVVDIIYDLLVNYADIDPKFIPYNNDVNNKDEWDIEKENWLSLKTYYTVVSTSEGVQTLIEELTEQSLILFWWDELSQKIKLKVIAPPQRGEVVNYVSDKFNILENSMSIQNDDSKRFSEIWVYSGVKNWAETSEIEDFTKLHIKADLEKEGEDQYGDRRIKKVMSRWFTLDTHSTIFTERYMLMSKDTPKVITLQLDAKEHEVKTGDFLDVSTRLVLDATGSPTGQRYHVTEVKEVVLGHSMQVTAMTSGFAIDIRYGYIAPNGVPNYSEATAAQRDGMAFISPNNGLFLDGTEAYKII